MRALSVDAGERGRQRESEGAENRWNAKTWALPSFGSALGGCGLVWSFGRSSGCRQVGGTSRNLESSARMRARSGEVLIWLCGSRRGEEEQEEQKPRTDNTEEEGVWVCACSGALSTEFRTTCRECCEVITKGSASNYSGVTNQLVLNLPRAIMNFQSGESLARWLLFKKPLDRGPTDHASVRVAMRPNISCIAGM